MILKKAFWLAGICLALLAIFLPGWTKIQELKDRNRDLQTKNKRLERENQFLKKDLELIEKDSFFQEKIAREKMGVVRKGEVPVKIVTEGNP